MNVVKREATFRGNIVNHAVSLTKNEYPQWVAELAAIEIWDDDEKLWVDWTDEGCVEEGNGAIAYLVLFGAKGETLNCTQVKKATGWDGLSFSGLNEMDLSETIVQFRMEYNTYNEKTTLQVSWLDEENAEPGTAIRTLKPDELKSLDAKFKSQMTKAAPAKAPAKPGTKPKTPGKVNAKGTKATQKKGPVKKASKQTATEAAAVPPAAPAMPAMPTAEGELPDLRENKRTKKAAWETCVECRLEHITDKMLADAWLAAIVEVSGGNDPGALSEEQWYAVEVIVLEAVQSKI